MGDEEYPSLVRKKSHARYAPHAVSKTKRRAVNGTNCRMCRFQASFFYAVAGRRPSLPSLGGGGGISSLVFSAIILWKPIPTPSMTASRTAQPIAPLRMALGPPRTASAPPVKNPAMMAFQGSSFLRIPLTAQSNVLNMPPQTPKLPPSTGARALIAVMAGERREVSMRCAISQDRDHMNEGRMVTYLLFFARRTGCSCIL